MKFEICLMALVIGSLFFGGCQDEADAARWRLFSRARSCSSGSCGSGQYHHEKLEQRAAPVQKEPTQKSHGGPIAPEPDGSEPQQKEPTQKTPQQKQPTQKTTCCDDASCSEWCAQEVILLKEVNRHRVRFGLRPFIRNRAMINGCRRHSVRQYRRGGSCFHASSGFRGECVASGYGSPTAAVTGWMHSPGHRAILLSNAETVGISGYGNYWTLRTW